MKIYDAQDSSSLNYIGMTFLKLRIYMQIG
jgi:hypothetical protein